MLEQDICCGVDKDGAPINTQRVMVALAQTLLRSDLTQETKMRVLLLYLLSMDGVTREHRNKMVNTAALSAR